MSTSHHSGESGNYDRFTREEQLTAVFVAHFALLVFTCFLILVLHAVAHMPWLFVGIELGILVVCGWPLFRYEQIGALASKLGFGRASPQGNGTPDRAARLKLRLEGYALLVAFALQMGALVPLLKQTGGPVKSPFAQMTVALAIFTPYLANRPLTITSVGLIIGVYYVGLVAWMGSIESEWPYLIVNLSILAASVLLTFGDIRRRASDAAA